MYIYRLTERDAFTFWKEKKKKKKSPEKHLQRHSLFEQNQRDQYSPTTYSVSAETTLSDTCVLI